MNRTEKKCIIASACFHLLLILILLVGPAFFSGNRVVDDSPILEFIPVITTDDKVSGGGDPTVKSLPAAQVQPPQPAPAPTPPPQHVPEAVIPPEPVKLKTVETAKPVKEVKEDKKDPDAVEPADRKPKKPVISTELVKRDTRNDANAAKLRAQQEAREAAAAQRRLVNRLDQAVTGIKGGLAGSTEIRLKGPGGGGLPYANFLDAVKSVYARDWRVPDGAADDSATAVASVVIARDGTVLSARIIRSSGSPEVDRSVRATLERVKFAAPLPPGAREDQREVTINFNVKAAKLLLG